MLFNEFGHKKHNGLRSRKTFDEAWQAGSKTGDNIRSTIKDPDKKLSYYEDRNIGAFVFEHSERNGWFGEKTTDYIFSGDLNVSNTYSDNVWNLQIGNGMEKTASVSVGTGWFGVRSDIKAILVNSGSSPITKSGFEEYSLYFNNVPVYNTIGNTTYRIQSSGKTGFGTCSVVSGVDGGYCN